MKKPFFKTFIGNLIIIGLLCILLYWLFFGSLSLITKHNDVQTVPDLKNKNINQAINLIKKAGLEYYIDSVYQKDQKPLIVLDQFPEKGATVKSGRLVKITVNKGLAPLVDMPQLVTQTFRTALLTLRRLGLEMGDTIFVFDISEDIIMGQKINGRDIPFGTKIPLGTKIDLVVSAGLSDIRVNVPDLLGLTVREAMAKVKDAGLQFVISYDDRITDTTTAKVYSQLPESRNDYGEPQSVYQGEFIDFRVKQNPTIVRKKYIQRPVDDYWTPPDYYTDSSGNVQVNPPPNRRPSSSNIPNTTPENQNTNGNEPAPKYELPKQSTPDNRPSRPDSRVN